MGVRVYRFMILICIILMAEVSAQVTFTEQTISSSFVEPRVATIADYNGDGLPDFSAIGTRIADDDVGWWANDGTPKDGTWVYSSISKSSFDDGRFLISYDIDGDGDIDLVGGKVETASTVNVAWWENSDGNGDFSGFRHDLTADDLSGGVDAEDLDNDGDVDIIAGFYTETVNDTGIVWYENDGAQNFTKNLVDTLRYVNHVGSWDINNDGRLDIVASASIVAGNGGILYYWLNNGGAPITWNRQIIDNNLDGVVWVYGKDVDLDGDVDILVAALRANTIAWYENTGSGWVKHTVDAALSGARSVHARDIEGDGDIDIIASGETDNAIVWYENDGSQNFTKHILSTAYTNARYAEANDVDGDGDPDILAVALGDPNASPVVDGFIRWFENDAEDLQTIAAGDAAPVSFWSNTVTIDFSAGTDGDVSVFLDSEEVPRPTRLGSGIDHVAEKQFYTLWTNKTSYTASVTFKYSVWPGVDNPATLVIAWWNPSTAQWEVAGTGQSVNTGDQTITVSGITQFGQFVLASTNADNPLPVLLSSFTARIDKQGVLLQWSTASEFNNQGFEIYRAESADTDPELLASYRNYPELEGAGNTNTTRSYRFRDISALFGKTYYYYLEDVAFDGRRMRHGPVKVTVSEPIVVDRPHTAIGNFVLYQNVPNPFNPTTEIRFQIPAGIGRETGQPTSLRIYNAVGQLITTLVNAQLEPGEYVVEWNGRDATGNPVPSGVYFYVLESGYLKLTQKMLLMK